MKILVMILLLSGCTPVFKQNCKINPAPIVMQVGTKLDIVGGQVSLSCLLWE